MLTLKTEAEALAAYVAGSGALDAPELREAEEAPIPMWLRVLRDGRVIGQLMHTWEWSDWRNGQIWWLQSVYVLPEYRRRGVFRRLHAEVLELARADGGVCGIRLYVERENAVAQATYRALGFARPGYEVMEQTLEARSR